MRLVVDTNVIVSAALKKSSWPGETPRWVAKYGGLLKSTDTEREAMAIMGRPRLASKLSPEFVQQLTIIFASAEPVTIQVPIAECHDPKDDRFLALAFNGRAGVIISGDDDLLVMDRFRGIPIVTPAMFGQTRLL